MPVGLLSRYRHQKPIEVVSPSRGKTRALPIRRFPVVRDVSGDRTHQFASYETVDLLALKYFGREDLYWALLDANRGQLLDDFEPGQKLTVPSVSQVTQIQIPGR
jgi:phage tail protein X